MIHQVYGTHCTYRTSAIERREGEAARAVVGYSARASSLAWADVRDHYLAVSRFLHYHLPSDAPADLVLKLKQRQAERRLFYCPSSNGLRVMGQVCFREKDSGNPPSPGSYFGHILTTEEKGPAWNVLDCLRLWKAPGWCVEDRDDIGFQLDAFDDFDSLLTALLEDQPAPDYDIILEQFLGLPASPRVGTSTGLSQAGSATGGPKNTSLKSVSAVSPSLRPGTHPGPLPPPPPPPPPRRKKDNGGAGSPAATEARLQPRPASQQANGPTAASASMNPPSRWNAIDIAARRKLFRSALEGYLIAKSAGKSLLLVAEPDIVVLMVYVIARLLPTQIREHISFSTYETTPDRLNSSIAIVGIGFHHQTTDLPAERYRRDFVVNTYKGETSDGNRSTYVQLVWDDSLLTGGWLAACRVVNACETVDLREIGSLGRCADAEKLSRAIVDPAAAPMEVSRENVMGGYIRRRVAQHLSDIPLSDSRLEQLAAFEQRRQEILHWTSSEGVCARQVKKILSKLNATELDQYLAKHPRPEYVDAAQARYAELIPNGGVVQFLKDPNVLAPLKDNLLPHLFHKLQVEELVDFLKITSVPPDLKQKAVDRLSARVPPSRILSFLEDDGVPPERKRQALDNFVGRIEAKDRLKFLAMPQVEWPFKVRLVHDNANSFTGPEVIAILDHPAVPPECKDAAVKQAGFLDHTGRGELLAFLLLGRVPDETKTAQLDRLANELSETDVLSILSDSGVPIACKEHTLDHPLLTKKLSAQRIPSLVLSPQLQEPCKQQILASADLAARIPAEQIASLLVDPGLPPQCRTTACRNPALLDRIPEDRLLPLLTNVALPEPCRETIFDHATSGHGIRVSRVVPLLTDVRLPFRCKVRLFTCDSLLDQLSGSEVADLLQGPRLPANVKQSALSNLKAVRKIPADRALGLLLDESLPSSCHGPIAETFAPTLPDEHLVGFLGGRGIAVETKLTALNTHASRLTLPQLEDILRNPSVPPECKTTVAGTPALAQRVAQGDLVKLLRDQAVPAACRESLSARLDLATVPKKRLLDALEIDTISDDRKSTALASRCQDLDSEDVYRLLASPLIPTVLKDYVAGLPTLLERIKHQDALQLLASGKLPQGSIAPLLARLPAVLALADVESLFKSCHLSDPQQITIVNRHLNRRRPEDFVPFLCSQHIPGRLKERIAEALPSELPEHDYERLLRLDCLSEGIKGDCLASFVSREKRLPRGCEDLQIEELAKVDWTAGPMRELFYRLDAASTLALIEKPVVPTGYGVDRDLYRLSTYVSLFKATALSADHAKARLLREYTTKRLVARRQEDPLLMRWASSPLPMWQTGQRERRYAPEGPASVHRALESLMPFLAGNPTVSSELSACLRELSAQVLNDLVVVIRSDPAQIERRIAFLEMWGLNRLWDFPTANTLGSWKTILNDLRELGQASPVGDSDLALTASGRSLREIRAEIVAEYDVLFSGANPASYKEEIRALAEHFHVDMHHPQNTSAVGSYSPLAMPTRRLTPRRKNTLLKRLTSGNWVFWGTAVVLSAGLGIAAGYFLRSVRDHNTPAVVTNEAPKETGSKDVPTKQPALQRPDSRTASKTAEKSAGDTRHNSKVPVASSQGKEDRERPGSHQVEKATTSGGVNQPEGPGQETKAKEADTPAKTAAVADDTTPESSASGGARTPPETDQWQKLQIRSAVPKISKDKTTADGERFIRVPLVRIPATPPASTQPEAPANPKKHPSSSTVKSPPEKPR